jgi:hypothetical protein
VIVGIPAVYRPVSPPISISPPIAVAVMIVTVSPLTIVLISLTELSTVANDTAYTGGAARATQPVPIAGIIPAAAVMSLVSHFVVVLRTAWQGRRFGEKYSFPETTAARVQIVSIRTMSWCRFPKLNEIPFSL